MIKRTVKYTDFNNVKREEDFYFNLTKDEVLDLQSSVTGGYSAYIEGISNAEDISAVYDQIKKFIDISYGVKSDDGRKFTKSPETLMEFKSTNAYSNLIFDMLDQQDSLVDFVNGILPQDLLARANAVLEKTGGDVDEARKLIENE